MTHIFIDNVGSREEAQRKIDKLQALTKNNFHNFTFHICAAYGSFDIMVGSEYNFSEQDKEKALLEAFSFALMALV